MSSSSQSNFSLARRAFPHLSILSLFTATLSSIHFFFAFFLSTLLLFHTPSASRTLTARRWDNVQCCRWTAHSQFHVLSWRSDRARDQGKWGETDTLATLAALSKLITAIIHPFSSSVSISCFLQQIISIFLLFRSFLSWIFTLFYPSTTEYCAECPNLEY